MSRERKTVPKSTIPELFCYSGQTQGAVNALITQIYIYSMSTHHREQLTTLKRRQLILSIKEKERQTDRMIKTIMKKRKSPMDMSKKSSSVDRNGSNKPFGPIHTQSIEEVKIYWRTSTCSIGKLTISIVDFVSSFVDDVIFVSSCTSSSNRSSYIPHGTPYRWSSGPYHEPESRRDYQLANKNRRGVVTSSMSR